MGAIDRPDQLSEEMIDATLADSFPASDPPSWTLGRERHRKKEPITLIAESPRSDNKEKLLSFILVTAYLLSSFASTQARPDSWRAPPSLAHLAERRCTRGHEPLHEAPPIRPPPW